MLLASQKAITFPADEKTLTFSGEVSSQHALSVIHSYEPNTHLPLRNVKGNQLDLC